MSLDDILAKFSPDETRGYEIFFPFALRKIRQAISDKQRFVHYTSADTALNICRKPEIWLRKSNCMNDFMEIEYGLECLNYALSQNKEKIRSILDGLHEGTFDRSVEWYNGWLSHFRNDTYIFCISEHYPEEDSMGRLSMWRAYGGDTGVALVLNPEVILTPSEALNAHSSPVAYFSKEQASTELSNLLDNIANNKDYILQKGENYLHNSMCEVFRMSTLCMKHPGFREEAEWRVIYSPQYSESSAIKRSIQSIGGVIQPVYAIPLKDMPESGLNNLEIPQLVERVIIGPTEFPDVIAEAMADLLSSVGVTEPKKRVFTSDIPLRR